MTSSILIHANTGENVGLGHLVRCLTLANELYSRGIDVEFLLKNDDDAVAFARKEGIEPTTTDPERLHEDILTASVDVVIIDSYDFTTGKFKKIAKKKRLIVIDELGDRYIPAEIIINNNIYADNISYPAAETILRGPKYCMLREPFRNLSEPPIRHRPESVLVTVGGSDLADSFVDILNVAGSVSNEIAINAIIGPYFNPPEDTPDNVIFHREPSAIHELMWDADMAVSGGGQTLYELAVCGTPTVALTLGLDQVRNIDGFVNAGFCFSAGTPDEYSFEATLQDQLQILIQENETRRQMAKCGRTIVDGDGVIRVADSIINLI